MKILCLIMMVMLSPASNTLAADKSNNTGKVVVFKDQQQLPGISPDLTSGQPRQKLPPTTGACGNQTKQFIPAEILQLDLQQLRAANENLELAIEILTAQEVTSDTEISEQLAGQSMLLLENIAVICKKINCKELVGQ